MQKLFIFCLGLFLFSDLKSDSLYDSLGNYLGKTEDNGSMFDSLGGYQGRVDSNNKWNSIKSNWISSQGKFVEKFENKFQEILS